jgi:ligand-binding SRPBCC domain-containing protein
VQTLITEVWLPRRREELLDFFSKAQNLDLITPPWLHFHVVTPMPIVMGRGTMIEYRLRWRGLPLYWRTEITCWQPPECFIDQQVKGPYRQWIHEHVFEECDGGTLMRDRVDYAVPGWFVEPILSRWIVTPDVERIFAFRRQEMERLFSHRD